MNPKSILNDTAVYWGNPQPTGYAGGYYYDDPIEIDARWIDEQRKYLGKTKGFTTFSELVSNAVIIVAQDLEPGGMIALTTLNDLTSSELPEDNGAYEIKATTKTPDIKSKIYIREVMV